MLIGKQHWKMTFDAWSQVNAHLKASLVHAQVTPHNRDKHNNARLLALAVIKSLTERIEKRLVVFTPELSITLTSSEALAILVAHQERMFQENLYLQTMVIAIDRKAA